MAGILEYIRIQLSGIINARGTIATPTGIESYPTHIATEGAGGCHGYLSMEDFLAAPLERLHVPMIALVEDGPLIKTFKLLVRPTSADYTNGSLGLDNYTDFWEEEKAKAIMPVYVYIRNNTEPPTPFGAQPEGFDLYNEEVPLPISAGWSAVPPDGIEDLWISRALFRDINGNGIFQLYGEWSEPALVSKILTLADVDARINTLVNLTNYYTKSEVNNLLSNYETVANNNTKLAAVNSSSYFTQINGSIYTFRKEATWSDVGVFSKSYSAFLANSSTYTKNINVRLVFGLYSNNRGNPISVPISFTKSGNTFIGKQYILTLENVYTVHTIEACTTVLPGETLFVDVNISAAFSFDITKVADITFQLF